MRYLIWTLLLLAIAAPLHAQDGQLRVGLEAGMIHFGPVVTAETTHFVRFGSNGGFDNYAAITVEGSRTYARLRLAPTQVYIWSVADTVHQMGKAANPRANPYRYRPIGTPRDLFVWTEMSAGLHTERRIWHARAGAGGIVLAQTNHQWWGARVGVAPKLEVMVSTRLLGVDTGCQATLAHVGSVAGRWTVLERAAGNGPGSPDKRWLTPLSCGVSLWVK